ncbi:MAG: hypothetical protein QG589_346 [Patescibacteria group bacterium]|nr:hypothetical protein [Patescibacteria group bacterium]
MSINGKIVLAHKGFFNKECQKIYRENSREVCKISGSMDYVDIIELDIRKSKDGILYCYHGDFFQYYISLKIPRIFSYLQKKYHVDSLADILEVIPETKIICFDLKDKGITKLDILHSLNGKKFKDLVFGSSSISFLDQFDGMSKFFWGNIFVNFII